MRRYFALLAGRTGHCLSFEIIQNPSAASVSQIGTARSDCVCHSGTLLREVPVTTAKKKLLDEGIFHVESKDCPHILKGERHLNWVPSQGAIGPSFITYYFSFEGFTLSRLPSGSFALTHRSSEDNYSLNKTG